MYNECKTIDALILRTLGAQRAFKSVHAGWEETMRGPLYYFLTLALGVAAIAIAAATSSADAAESLTTRII